MKFHLEKVIFRNRAPFKELDIDFNENGITVLSAVNGKGKTTLLTHIVDAFYEMARPNFPNEFEGKENKYYRVSSSIFNLDQNQPSFFYLRFKMAEEYIDYIDIRNECTEDQYNDAITLDNKIQFGSFVNILKENHNIKMLSPGWNKKKATELFSSNLLTYFPSYRYELPGYLNDPYKIKLEFNKTSRFSGYLINPIEVIAGLPQFANWLMDIVLDMRSRLSQGNELLFNNLNVIATLALISKNYGNVRFGVGPRSFGNTRIQILENKENGKQLYPNIFNLSSGESALICLFGELIRQADNNKNNILLDEITGIVLIDEIDKHLHITLQKEVLPLLLNIFPRIQFILSSHSPFLSMGLAESVQDRSNILDLESGISIKPTNDSQYEEVYEMMINENERYKNLYNSIKQEIDSNKELQIITEGKNTKHIEKAIKILDASLLNKVKIISGSEDRSGDQQLKNAYNIMSSADHKDKFLFVWDCDSQPKTISINETSCFSKFCFSKNESNKKAKRGIENLYPDSVFTDEVYDIKETEIEYGGSKREKVFNKAKFINKIQNEIDKEVFKLFAPLIEKIKSITSVSEITG